MLARVLSQIKGRQMRGKSGLRSQKEDCLHGAMLGPLHEQSPSIITSNL